MNFLMPYLAPLFKALGSSLWAWVISYLTGPQLLASIKSFLKTVAAKKKLAASKTEDPNDDLDAQMFSDWVDQVNAAEQRRLNVNNP
jgi:hypothetical protein